MFVPFFCHCKGRNPKLWPTQKHTVTDTRRPQAALILPPLKLTLLRPFSKEDAAEVTKDENTSMSKEKCFKNSISPRVFALSYMPLYGVSISVLCKDIHGSRCWVHGRLEFWFFKHFWEVPSRFWKCSLKIIGWLSCDVLLHRLSSALIRGLKATKVSCSVNCTEGCYGVNCFSSDNSL